MKYGIFKETVWQLWVGRAKTFLKRQFRIKQISQTPKSHRKSWRHIRQPGIVRRHSCHFAECTQKDRCIGYRYRYRGKYAFRFYSQRPWYQILSTCNEWCSFWWELLSGCDHLGICSWNFTLTKWSQAEFSFSCTDLAGLSVFIKILQFFFVFWLQKKLERVQCVWMYRDVSGAFLLSETRWNRCDLTGKCMMKHITTGKMLLFTDIYVCQHAAINEVCTENARSYQEWPADRRGAVRGAFSTHLQSTKRNCMVFSTTLPPQTCEN